MFDKENGGLTVTDVRIKEGDYFRNVQILRVFNQKIINNQPIKFIFPFTTLGYLPY